MRRGLKTLGFALLLTLLATLHVATSADAASLGRQCRLACRDEIAACVAAGGHRRACRRSTLGRCRQEGVTVCQSQAGQTRVDTTAPSTPSGLNASASACGQISLGWSASTDSGSGVRGYNVYRAGTFLKQVLAPATSTTDSPLPPSTTYSYTVSAFDNAGNESSKSGSKSIQTLACTAT